MKILLIWALVFVALVKAKQRYSYIVHHKGSWGFFPDSCRFECLEHKYTVDLWMEPESKCPQFINEAQRKYALFHYDLEQVCSHKVCIIIFSSGIRSISKIAKNYFIFIADFAALEITTFCAKISRNSERKHKLFGKKDAKVDFTIFAPKNIEIDNFQVPFINI